MNENTKNYFRTNILNLLLQVEQTLTPILKETIIIIVEQGAGYFKIWPDLMEKLGVILKNKDYKSSIEIYDVISKVIKRYHIESKSYELFAEIKNTIKEICPTLTEDALKFSKWLIEMKDWSYGEQSMLILKRILKIFYSINYQDFPEFFEDHLSEWITILSNALAFECTVPQLYDAFIALKSKTMKCVNLYFLNYYDDIVNYVNGFYPLIWKLIPVIKQNDPYSTFTKQLLMFYRNSFQCGYLKNIPLNDVNTIISQMILPNLKMTQVEYEDFEDNPINFLKVELEESDMDSNKYYSINLLKILIGIYPSLITQYLNETIQTYLNNYYTDKNKNWNDKIVAINLIFAVQIKNFAQRIGVTEMNPNSTIDVPSLIREVFTKEFESLPSPLITQVYSMKFLTMFRLQIPIQFLSNMFGMLINILNTSNNVIQNACLLTLEKILFMKDLNTRENLSKAAVNNQTTFTDIITSLMKFINTDNNIFAMRCFYRTLFLTDNSYYSSMAESIASTMKSIIKNIIINPQQDEYNYYFFETCSLVMNKLANVDMNRVIHFESQLRDELNSILVNTVTDLMGYAFQFFAHYVNISNSQNEFYTNLLQKVLFDMNSWNLNMKYMYKPFIAFLKVSFIKHKDFYMNNISNIQQIFTISEGLLNVKCYSHTFELLDCFMNVFNPIQFNYLNSIEAIIDKAYNELNKTKTDNPKAYRDLGKELILYISKLVIIIQCQNTLMILNKIGGMNFFKEMADLFSFIDSNNDKKLMLFSYCLILSTFTTQIGQDDLKFITLKLVHVIQSFYKLSFGFGFANNKEFNDISYAAQNYNKVRNAEIVIEFSEYSNIYKMEEGEILFKAMSSILVKDKINLLQLSLSDAKERKRNVDYIKSLASKYNFPI